MEIHAHIPTTDEARIRFIERTLNSMFPHYENTHISDEPVTRHGSDEWISRVWFTDAPDVVVTFRFATPNVQITSEVNA